MKSFTVLKLKIKDPPDILMHTAELCRTGKNAAVEDWLLRHRGKPESEKQAKTKADKDGNVKCLSESTKLYHAITAAVPELGTTQASMLAANLNSYLGAKVDWRRGEKTRRRDAILSYQDRPPFTTSLEVPLHNNQVTVTFGDDATVTIRNPVRGIGDAELTISLRKLPPGYQAFIREFADGERKLADSRMIHKDGDWYWHVPIKFETEVRSENVATLEPTIGSTKDGKQSDRPFKLTFGDGRAWHIGDGRYLLAQMQRLGAIRKEIGWRYRQRMGAGHGRKKVDAAVRKRRHQEHNMVSEVRRRAIADVVRQCVRRNIGTIEYREPSLPLREKCWFGAVGLEWDWTRFLQDLKNAAARQCIQVNKTILKWKEAFPDGETKRTA